MTPFSPLQLSRQLLFALSIILFQTDTNAQLNWSSILSDPSGDGGIGTLLDGTQLEYAMDDVNDRALFRISCANLGNASQAADIGFNVMFRYVGGGSTFKFWGANNNSENWNKLLTVWVTGSPPNSYSGTIGISDAAGVNASPANYDNLNAAGVISFEVDTVNQTATIGIPRWLVVSDANMGGSSQYTVFIAAATGSSVSWNDDIYGSNTSFQLLRPIKIQGIFLSTSTGDTTITAPGDTLRIEHFLSPSNPTNPKLDWSVDDTALASIDSNGILTPKKDGLVKVTAAASDGSNVSSDINILLSNQEIPVSSITVTAMGGATGISSPGGSLQLMVDVLPVNAANKAVNWSVNDAAIASVDATGLLAALSNGSVNVTATAQDGSSVFGTLGLTMSNQATSVSDPVATDRISVFPNPTNGMLDIELRDVLQGSLEVLLFDLNGRLMKEVRQGASVDGIQLDLTDLSKGIYRLVLIADEELIATRRILRN